MNRSVMKATVVALAMRAAIAAAVDFPTFPVRRCGPDAVLAGTVCMDKYEASVWRVPNPTTANALLVRRIQLGRATEADLRAGGATQLGTENGNYEPCGANGQNCANEMYAVSLPSVVPASFITWFQAQEACANARKRLPTSAEWQVAANGTPDSATDNRTTDCNTVADQNEDVTTGARSHCVSARGAFDMVGNLYEWVADWVPSPTNCPGWGGFSDDDMCIAGASTTSNSPGALVRGGSFLLDRGAGPLAVLAFPPDGGTTIFIGFVGFRCAR